MADFTPSTNLIVILSCISSQHGVLVDDGQAFENWRLLLVVDIV
jgi:hypothetical protein